MGQITVGTPPHYDFAFYRGVLYVLDFNFQLWSYRVHNHGGRLSYEFIGSNQLEGLSPPCFDMNIYRDVLFFAAATGVFALPLGDIRCVGEDGPTLEPTLVKSGLFRSISHGDGNIVIGSDEIGIWTLPGELIRNLGSELPFRCHSRTEVARVRYSGGLLLAEKLNGDAELWQLKSQRLQPCESGSPLGYQIRQINDNGIMAVAANRGSLVIADQHGVVSLSAKGHRHVIGEYEQTLSELPVSLGVRRSHYAIETHGALFTHSRETGFRVQEVGETDFFRVYGGSRELKPLVLGSLSETIKIADFDSKRS